MDNLKKVNIPRLNFWEKADIPFALLSIVAAALKATVTGVFRDQSSPEKFAHHVKAAVIRRLLDRTSGPQKLYVYLISWMDLEDEGGRGGIENSADDPTARYINLPTTDVYISVMHKGGHRPEIVSLAHDAEGFWLGNKDAKTVVVYYHGGGFAMAAVSAHFQFWLDLIHEVNNYGHDIAVFFLHYTLTPYATYPTQLRQAVEALRHILVDTDRSASSVILGGDSAGGNLAMATLLHLSHPHPEIEPILLLAPLAGVFSLSPWINFKGDWISMKENRWKDIITPGALRTWSAVYIADKGVDYWNEPDRAPVGWWKNAKTERMLILAGRDEILLSSIEQFAKKIKSVFWNSIYYVGYGESHDAPFFVEAGSKEGTQTGNKLRKWILSLL
ncbi:hypothetical protein N7510_005167 [Penicillium lagena]|uniref:uncharacterized protein n=1 Tax=Penicillium lagena TaxID=94218 RepID=UPI0025409347|nr:uncharacterized protein N7510_005167 [Penicillium lagena]KAJ5611973.1 hypothetical protein N7510_005167 [Penicillium lagena]